jgi:hypothetical protein
MQRYHRALNERIYLLSARENKNNLKFRIRGSSLNIYKQKLDKKEFYCSCPDHTTRDNFCKHLLFLIGKVAGQTTMAQNLCIYNNLWDEDHYKIVSEDLIERLKKRLNKDIEKEICNDEQIILEDCPICFEKIDNNEKIYKCKNVCNNYFHYDCINKWINAKKTKATCPLCRTVIVINENDSYIDENVKIKFIN